MADYKMAPVINAITSCMPCPICPYPCKAKNDSSKANCSRRWYEILHFLENDGDKRAVLEEVYELYKGDYRK